MNILYIIILIFSVVLHELAHGYMADYLGDPTARLAGRLSLNPMRHLDWMGSVIIPFFLVISGAPFLFGWAKPVPFNLYNLKNQRWGASLVALAGPISNLLIVGVFALLLHLSIFSPAVLAFFMNIIIINIALAVFNLVPIPPLDGHYILFDLLPSRFDAFKDQLRRIAWPLLILFVLFGWQIIAPLVSGIFNLLV